MTHFELRPSSVPSLGARHICAGCEARFYDLNKQPVTCPKCERIYVPVVKAPRRSRTVSEPVIADRGAVPPKAAAKSKQVHWKRGYRK